MATGESEKLDSLLECPICYFKLSSPRAFPCLHIFCQPCIDNLQPKSKDAIPNYECPICRQLTTITNVRTMPFLNDLLEAVDIVKKGHPICEQCKKMNASFRCADCKQNMCPRCRTEHDGWVAMKDHDWSPLGGEEETRAIVDKQIYCSKHPKKIVEFSCKDCNELICSLCNVSDHKLHHADTIEDAISNALPVIHKKKEDILKRKAENEDNLDRTKAKLVEFSKEYDDMEKSIQEKKQLQIKKLDEDAKIALQNLADIKIKHVGEMEAVVRRLELEIKSQRNIVAMTDTALTTAQGTSLLQAIQSDVTTSLGAAHVDKPIRSQALLTNIRAMFHSTPPVESLIGTVSDVSHTFIPGVTSQPLREFETKSIVPKTKTDLNFNANKFDTVGNDVWLVEWDKNTIHVLANNGKAIRNIVLNDMGKCRSVVQAMGGKVAVAATKGLFLVDHAGRNPQKLLAGDMCGVSAHGQNIFTLDNGAGKVHHHHQYYLTKAPYALQNSFSVDSFDPHARNTIQATKEHVYVALYAKNWLHQYSHVGKLLQTYALRGSAIGLLCNPWLCAADHEGTVLIADQKNNRLQTVNGDGKWARVRLEGLNDPCCARLNGDTLFVLQGANPRFKTFTVS